MASQAATRMTYEEFVKLPDDGRQYELIDGELIVNPSPVPRHQMIAGNIYFAIRLFLQKHGGALVYSAPIDVRLGDDIVQPDVVVIAGNRVQIVGDRNVVAAPDLIVEVLSEGTRRKDEIVKRKLYERAQVGEYWIVDPELELVKMHRLVDGALQRVAEIGTESGGVLTTSILPDFTLDIREVFAMPQV